MFSLTVREQSLVVVILLAMVLGGVVQHLRHRLPPGVSISLPPAAQP